MTEWKPIDTAPKDGTAILIYPAYSMWLDHKKLPNYIPYVCRWKDDAFGAGWIEASGEEYHLFEPTHWMPLPAAPEPPK